MARQRAGVAERGGAFRGRLHRDDTGPFTPDGSEADGFPARESNTCGSRARADLARLAKHALGARWAARRGGAARCQAHDIAVQNAAIGNWPATGRNSTRERSCRESTFQKLNGKSLTVQTLIAYNLT